MSARLTKLILLLFAVLILLGLWWYVSLHRLEGADDTLVYDGHSIPLTQLRIVDPHPGCSYQHYHAIASHSVTTTDGTVLTDDSDCGFGPAH